MLTGIETTGTIRANRLLELDERLPADTPERVKVIVLYDDDASEDIYSLADGKPVSDDELVLAAEEAFLDLDRREADK